MKYSKFMIISILICIMLSGCTVARDTSKDKTELNNNEANDEIRTDEVKENDEPFIIKSDMIITRAVASKMLALASFDKRSIEISDREIEFEDTSPDKWFDKYINVVVINKWMLGSSNKFHPLSPLTNKELDIISKRFDIELEKYQILIQDVNENDAVSYEDFMTFYKALYNKNKDDYGIRLKNLIVFATPANSSSLNSWEMATNYGMYSFEGLTLDCYIDNKIEVMVRDNEIVAVTGIVNKSPKLTNAYIESIKGTVATVFMGGISRDLTINHDDYKDKENIIADIVIDKGHITGILLKEKRISEKVLLVSNEKVSLDNLGTYSIAKDAKVYSVTSGTKWKGISSIIVGYNSTDFVVDDEGKVCAAIIRDEVEIENIRVLISTTAFNNKYHKSVSITSTTDYILEYGVNKKQMKAEEILDISSEFFTDGDRISIKPLDNGKVTINTIKRGNSMTPPSYRGIIEISKDVEGYLIVNEVPIEEYLYAVIPSEMPTSYGLEAAKTQAVCARSYAYTQFYSNRFCKYGAHVIDSIQSQVYNNVPENETSINAVNATSKQGLTYKGRVVSTNFFSTSCGYTASSGDVWAGYKNKGFPTTSPEYLQAKPQFDGGNKYEGLWEEELFREFITDESLDSYDKNFPYYRWSVELTREHIEASINGTLGKRYKQNPKLIKVLDENEIFRSRPIESIGQLKDIGIYKRGAGGNITEMIIEGSEGIIKISTEYNVRLLISPLSYREGINNVPIDLQDGNQVKQSTLMPSAFYIMDKEYDDDGNLVRILFRGGGYGHGVGMSQNGVKGMVDKGYDFLKILKHYYSGTEVKEIY